MKQFAASTTRGSTLVTVLVLGSICIMLVVVLIGRVVIQERSLRMSLDNAVAIQIAETGLEKLRWHLAHNPQGYDGPQNVSINGDGQYIFNEDYRDPQTNEVVGEIKYVVEPEEFCGLASHATVTVTGTSFIEGRDYTLQQVHTQDTAANYAYIYNDDVQAGSDRLIRGRYHSNSSIEMNGQNDSVVSSSQTNGVFGNPVHPDARQDLWQDEVGTIDFNALALDLETIYDSADTYNGDPVETDTAGDDSPTGDRLFILEESCYSYNWPFWWGPYTNETCNGAEAFEVALIDDGDNVPSIEVWELDGLPVISRTNDDDAREKYCSNFASSDADHDVEPIATCTDYRSNYLGEFELDNSCPVAFFQGDVFLHGTTDSKLLIASGDLSGTDTSDVYLFNSINYGEDDGTDGLTVVSEGDIKIGYSVPDDMEVRGIFIAQSGRYGRDNYDGNWSFDRDVFQERDFLQTVGSIISNEGGGTKWTTSGGSFVSGFRDRENYYDRSLSRRPPPLTPTVSENYTYLEWRDEEVR